MNEDRSSRPPGRKSREEKNDRSWLERLGQAFTSEPRTREDLIQLLREAQQRDLIDPDALGMIEGVLQVSEMQVRDIMIPRAQMSVVERDADSRGVLDIVIDSAHSRFPVIGENRDEVIGILLAKDLLPWFANHGDNGASLNIRELLRPAVFIPESKRLNVLLKEFRASRNHMAIVVDEYGGVAGLVTIEDVLEQIVGEIADEHDFDEDTFILDHANGLSTVKALTPIDEFNEHFGTDFSDEENDTVGGLVMSLLGHLPRRGETLTADGLEFRILRADNRRIYLMQVSRAGDTPAATGTAGDD
ncbi:MAG TPA: CBS domain-containing protein [Gammaproteobacteria bacterium]|nr:CBS domain-containing protein [Gammaproteobacteria bacterium]